MHEPDHVVEALAEDEQPRVLGLAQPRPQVAEGGIGADGDDVGTRRHHLADEPFLEAHERPEQLARLVLVFLRGGLDDRPAPSRLTSSACGVVVGATIRAAVDTGHQVREGRERARDDGKRRQQQRQHLLRIAPHEQLRQEQEAHEDEHQHRRQEEPDAVFRPAHALDLRQQHCHHHRDHADAEPGPGRTARADPRGTSLSRSRGPALLSASIRSENRSNALKAARMVPRYTATHARRNTSSGITRVTPARSARRQAHPCGAGVPRGDASGPCRCRGRTRAGAAGRAGRAP